MKTKKSKATDISPAVKKAVFERDQGACVICGNRVNVMPNAHYIRRSRGGKGIEENIVTMCSELTDLKCHHRYDFGSQEEQDYLKARIKDYLMRKYPNWNEDDLIYNKFKGGK